MLVTVVVEVVVVTGVEVEIIELVDVVVSVVCAVRTIVEVSVVVAVLVAVLVGVDAVTVLALPAFLVEVTAGARLMTVLVQVTDCGYLFGFRQFALGAPRSSSSATVSTVKSLSIHRLACGPPKAPL